MPVDFRNHCLSPIKWSLVKPWLIDTEATVRCCCVRARVKRGCCHRPVQPCRPCNGMSRTKLTDPLVSRKVPEIKNAPEGSSCPTEATAVHRWQITLQKASKKVFLFFSEKKEIKYGRREENSIGHWKLMGAHRDMLLIR